MKKKGLYLFLLLIMICCCLPVRLTGTGSLLVVADPFDKADAAVILSGGELERVDTAAILYHNQSVNTVILNGNWQYGTKSQCHLYKITERTITSSKST